MQMAAAQARKLASGAPEIAQELYRLAEQLEAEASDMEPDD